MFSNPMWVTLYMYIGNVDKCKSRAMTMIIIIATISVLCYCFTDWVYNIIIISKR